MNLSSNRFPLFVVRSLTLARTDMNVGFPLILDLRWERLLSTPKRTVGSA
jgi:hypothetical protein